MRYLTLSFLLGFLLGCQTAFKPPCGPSRQPSSAALCSQVFKDPPPQEPSLFEIQSFFRQLEPQGLSGRKISKQIKTDYTAPEKLALSFRSITPGQVLLERLAQGDPTARLLVDLGFTEKKDSILPFIGKTKSLVPPDDISVTISNLYKALIKASDQAGLNPQDIIWPSYLFSRKNPYGYGKDEYKFVRPGLDPVPPHKDGWKFIDSSEPLPTDFFAYMITERRMIIPPSLFVHDIGHIVDFIERPLYMKTYRQYQEVRENYFNKFILSSYPSEVGPIAYRGDIGVYFNEFLYLPSSASATAIKALLPGLKLNTLHSLSEHQNYYRNWDLSKLQTVADQLLANRYILFSPHGGAARDWSIERALTESHVMDGYRALEMENAIIFEQASRYPDHQTNFSTPQGKEFAYLMFETPELLRRLEWLTLASQNKEVPNGFAKNFDTLAREQNMTKEAFIQHSMALHIAEIEYRTEAGLFYKMTPEKIVQDTTLLWAKDGWKDYRETDTFKYFSTYRTYSTQWYYAVDVARKVK